MDSRLEEVLFGNKKGRTELALPFPFANSLEIYSFNNFFLARPASRINPDARRSMAASFEID